MRAFLEQFGVSLAVSAGLHLALVLFLVLSLDRSTPIAPAAVQPEAIEATVVDEALVEAEVQRLQETERRRQQELDEARREAERLAAEREREQRQLQALRRQQERERQQAQAERERQQREQAELERRRKAEEERLAEIERRRQEEAERLRREQQERERREAEEAERRRRETARQQMEARYIADIRDKVSRNWIMPDNWPAGTSCTIRVSQIPGGEVVQVRIVSSCGDPIRDRSLESAVLRASPLPSPPDPSVFSREIEFVFRPVN